VVAETAKVNAIGVGSMSKKIIGLISIAIAIAVLAVVLYVLSLPDDQTDDVTNPPSEIHYILGGENRAPVSEIRVSNESGGFTLIADRSSGNVVYRLAGYEEFPVSAAVTGIARNSGLLVAKSIVATPGSDLTAFGLSDPAAVAEIMFEDGTEVMLMVGDAAPGGGGRYVSDGSGTVYLANSGDAEQFLYGSLDLLSKRIVPGISGGMSFQTATLSGTVRPEEIVITGNTREGTASVSTHRIVSPAVADIDQTSGFSVIMSVFGLTAQRVAGTYAELEKFGLEAPYSTLEITPDTETGLPAFTLNAAAADNDGMVYLSSSLTGLIYQVHADSVMWLESTVFSLISKFAVLPLIDMVSRVIIELPEERYIFDLNINDEGELVVTSGEMKIDTAYFKNFYHTLVCASFDEQADEPLPANPVLLLSITYEYRDPAAPPDVVSFFDGPVRRAFIVLNNNPPFLTTTTYVNKVLTDLVRLLNGESVSPLR